VATDLHDIAPQLKLWSGVRSVVMVESRREFINGRDKGKVTKEWRYYLSSLVLSAADFNQRIRAHWAIENQCHWVLDVGMHEDVYRVRCGDGADNLGVLRRMARNLVSRENSIKGSKKSKLRRAAWHPDYLRDLLGLRIQPQPSSPKQQGQRTLPALAASQRTAARVATSRYCRPAYRRDNHASPFNGALRAARRLMPRIGWQ
jgi:predicted transposase YbfD/YdcC